MTARVSDVTRWAFPAVAALSFMRRRSLRWGATDDEMTATLPGDELVLDADLTATRRSQSAPLPIVSGRGSLSWARDEAGSTATTSSRTWLAATSRARTGSFANGSRSTLATRSDSPPRRP